MLSYRHAFHAGNHADVLKHFILLELIRHLNQKDAPYWYIDTHAGAGLYALDSGYATRLAEYQGGIGRLWQRNDLPPPLADYVAQVRSLNPSGELRIYPGSPWFAQTALRTQDKLKLFELHSSDSPLLQQNFRNLGRRVQIQAGDGFAGLKALLPPAPRRALVLIDPSYETRDDYRQTLAALKDSLKRFATGVYALWYPQLSRPEARQLPEQLRALPMKSWLDVSLSVATPSTDGFGMHGSGMFIINPPWTLQATLAQTLPCLVEALGQDAGATFHIEHGEATRNESA
jgi:23S rRNA (adenine2030-N6)-methyltransferase